MPNYQNGKVYVIRSPHTDDEYIGSTTIPLSKRMVCHRGKGNNYRSRSIIDAGDAYIELVEEFPCQNKEQLNRREGEIIRSRPNCINKAIAGRTYKEWCEDNAEKVSERLKKWADDNKEKVKESQKKWAEKNKEKIKEKRREKYRLAKSVSENEQKETVE